MSEQPGRLHVITDTVLQTGRTHAEIARLALEGGADTIQYREKRPLVTRELMVDAAAVLATCRAAHALAIVDDRVDVAFAVGATGLHLGRHDLPVDAARRILGPAAIIGGTANSLEEARTVWLQPIDYLGVGPVFGTSSKANPAPVLGLAALAAIAAESPVPVIAIGNITPDRVADVLAAGAYGIAVLSGVTCADDPRAAAARYAANIRAFLSGTGAIE
ncbi:MAG: thiamine phosphate synthase [Dehalococcoidia bacterium]|nr:thiamine phosphate synthase [Dehalococcoidia bacterium]